MRVPDGIINFSGAASFVTGPFCAVVAVAGFAPLAVVDCAGSVAFGGRSSCTCVAADRPLALDEVALCDCVLWHPTAHNSAETTVTIATRPGCMLPPPSRAIFEMHSTCKNVIR